MNKQQEDGRNPVEMFREVLANGWVRRNALALVELLAPYGDAISAVAYRFKLSEYSQPFPAQYVGDALPEELRNLAGPIAALEKYGPPTALERRRVAVLEGLALTRPPEALRDHVLKFSTLLKRTAHELEAAEEALNLEGWKFNHETKRVEKTDSGNRPFTFRRRMFVAVARYLRGGNLTNDKDLRAEVSELLTGWFGPEDLDPSKDGPIDAALKAEIAKRRN